MSSNSSICKYKWNVVNSKNTIQYLIDSNIPIRLACLSTSDYPRVVSLWYVYIDEKFYCATQNKSKIIRYLRYSPKCGFEIAGDRFPYRGIRGYGNASILKDRGEDILRMLVQKYFKGKETSRLYKLLLSETHLQNEVAIEIEPVSMYEWDYNERMSDSV
jgi:nitroimidazol reductase NimA-like FMN-containing flavoprotein (pyridoxamine 5'-phosphate oxidase superfamily)